jgi:hypothetical protein
MAFKTDDVVWSTGTGRLQIAAATFSRPIRRASVRISRF